MYLIKNHTKGRQDNCIIDVGKLLPTSQCIFPGPNSRHEKNDYTVLSLKINIIDMMFGSPAS